jgi:tetratricopeptide (TPR) repeat protein
MSALATPVAGGDNRRVPPRVSSPDFVGRVAELAQLEAALERAEHGSAAAVFVAGESGVGKTRLLRELERRAGERGARVLRGECAAFGAGELAYAPIAAALRRLIRELDPAGVDELVGPARDELARLVPELSAAPPGNGRPEGVTATGEAFAQARLFGLLRGLLDRLGADTPVLLAVEDLQWADRSTLEFLSSLLHGLRDERLLLVCTYRSDEALSAYVAAGLEAERVCAFAEAGQHFERALEIWDLVADAGERSELGLAAVVAHAAQNALVAGEPHRAVALGRRALELADGTGDVVAQALAYERLGGYLWAAGDSDAALAAHRDAVRVLPAEPPTPELARVLAAEATILMLRGPGEETRACAEHAVATARAVGERADEGRALNTPSARP